MSMLMIGTVVAIMLVVIAVLVGCIVALRVIGEREVKDDHPA